MSRFVNFLLGWIGGAVTATLMGVTLQTQNVIARLDNIGAEIGIAGRLSMTLYDIAHFGSVYIIFVAIGALIAYLCGALVYRLAGFGRVIVFMTAGAVAMLVMLTAMKSAFFGIQMVAGARSDWGVIMQMMAGATGGFVFAMLTRPSAMPSSPTGPAVSA